MQQQPAFRQIFWQTWRDLVFVHWEVDPAALERLLPPELEPDLFEGKAYVALVPFRMTGIRSVWLPPIPGTAPTRSSTSPGIDSATGQFGVVNVIETTAWPSLISTL